MPRSQGPVRATLTWVNGQVRSRGEPRLYITVANDEVLASVLLHFTPEWAIFSKP